MVPSLVAVLDEGAESGGAVAGDLLPGSVDQSGDIARHDREQFGRVDLEYQPFHNYL